MSTHNSVPIYHSDLSCAFRTVSSAVPEGTALGMIAADIKEIISSYLSDSESFREKGDAVNEYAALAYVHGWFDAGIFLGYLSGKSPSLYIPEDTFVPIDQQDRLKEKTLRYERMIRMAIHSVEIAPESGSPFYQAARTILKRAEDVCVTGNNPELSDRAYGAELGRISYEYGWLDLGLRAGLYRILANPELFTTETSRLP